MKIVIASMKSWGRQIAREIREKTNHEVFLLEEAADLNLTALKLLQPTYIFFPHWSAIIPADVFASYECVVFHMTDVPFGRGGSPLQNLIVREIYETKISALRCVAGLDAGPVYLKRQFSLYGVAEEIYIRAANIIKDMILEILEKRMEPVPQKGTPTVFKRRKAEESRMEAVETLEKAFDYIRMLDAEGYPPAFIEAGAFRYEFTRPVLREGRIIADVQITVKETVKQED